MGRSHHKIAVVGDLHFEAPYDAEYRAARDQLVAWQPDTVFQLGDQGGYSHCGTWQSFQEGLDFLRGFGRPFHTLLGNHDLEGPDYHTDADAVAAWCRAFGYVQPYRTVDLGETLAICLSTTRFRANTGCCHEVYLDDTQVAWLRATLAANRHRPTFIFSHAPAFGSGLRVLQSIHLKCPNAWLNHTDRPERFIALVKEHPQIKLWFSAHNHLGQCYADSLSRVNQCTFVHTGVIGPVSRDGRRHSRLVEFDGDELVLATIDHATGQATTNLRHDYRSGQWELVSPHDAADGDEHFAPPPFPATDRLRLGCSAFARHRDMLVEFDIDYRAPLGVVHDGLNGATVRVEREELHILDDHSGIQIVERNSQGRYYRVFEPNPRLSRRRSA